MKVNIVITIRYFVNPATFNMYVRARVHIKAGQSNNPWINKTSPFFLSICNLSFSRRRVDCSVFVCFEWQSQAASEDKRGVVTMKSNISRYISIYFTNVLHIFSGYFSLVDLDPQRYFDCSCRRCSDPTECGSFISAVRCFKDCKGKILSDARLQQNCRTIQHSATVQWLDTI